MIAELLYQPVAVSYSAHAALSALEARRHLENIDAPVVSALPYKPKGGELLAKSTLSDLLLDSVVATY